MRTIDADALWMDIIHSMDYCDDILEIIEKQPTIEPERTETHGDEISKSEVLETYAELYDVFDDNKAIRRILSNVYDKINNLPSSQPEQPTGVQDILQYLDDYLHPIVSPENWWVYAELYDMVSKLPSVQTEPSEITDEQAILHLQSTGWMQNHDREMYESGLREQLADDSGAYDSLIPCEDAVSRQAVIDRIVWWFEILKQNPDILIDAIKTLPSVPPKTVCVAKVVLSDEQMQEAVENAKNEILQVMSSSEPESEERPLTEDDYAYCAECDHVEMCRWYPMYGCEFKSRPSAEPERKNGRWLIKRFGADAQCSECGTYFSDAYDTDISDAFCRHCGAKMDGLKEDDQWLTRPQKPTPGSSA